MPDDNAREETQDFASLHLPAQALPDSVDAALGQALRYRRQAGVYHRLAEMFEQQAEYWEDVAERLRQGRPIDDERIEPGQWPTTGQFRGPGRF